jgi:predicted Abi (CAAX) family protease
MIRRYLRENTWRALKTPPWQSGWHPWLTLPPYAIAAVVIGSAAGLLHWQPLSGGLVMVLPLTLFLFPSLLEELVFRGIFIPRDVLKQGPAAAARAIALSTAAFVIWHPVNALTVNTSAIPLFLDPWFLAITTVLGVTCGTAYVLSGSLWVPVVIHWLSVTVWVLLLGGRNLLLETL